MPEQQLDLEEGLRRKEEGIQNVLAQRQIWLAGAVSHLTRKLEHQETISGDDLRDYTAPDHPNCVGGVFNRMKRANLIRMQDYTSSKAKTRHAAAVGIWRRFDSRVDKPIFSGKKTKRK